MHILTSSRPFAPPPLEIPAWSVYHWYSWLYPSLTFRQASGQLLTLNQKVNVAFSPQPQRYRLVLMQMARFYGIFPDPIQHVSVPLAYITFLTFSCYTLQISIWWWTYMENIQFKSGLLPRQTPSTTSDNRELVCAWQSRCLQAILRVKDPNTFIGSVVPYANNIICDFSV